MTKNSENIKFGKRVAQLRNLKGFSQEELAYRSDLNRTYMGEIERGEVTPSLLTIIKISNGLNIKKQELLDYE